MQISKLSPIVPSSWARAQNERYHTLGVTITTDWSDCEVQYWQVIALGMQKYWKSAWNKLDVVIVLTSDLEMILSYIVSRGVSFLKSPFRIGFFCFPIKHSTHTP
jgi:hypothetical protein